jgi:hypothetical protein
LVETRPSQSPDNHREVRIPRSGHTRGGIAYAKLLREVKVDRVWGGFRFDGELLRPGALVDEDELRPPDDTAAPILVLECAGGEGNGRGHRRRPTVYILWQYDPAAGEFREIARVASHTHDWTLDLGPVARRALHPPAPVLVDPEGCCRRLFAQLDQEIEEMDRAARRSILLALYDRAASRLVNFIV